MPAQESKYYTDQSFETSFPEKGKMETRFEACDFKNCDLTEIDFNGCDFTNCSFENCNLSMVKFVKNGFDQVQFHDCKLIGTDFSYAKDFLFHVNFSNCILDYAAFMKKKNRRSKFINCSLKGTDFSEADLTSALFDRCDLSATVFINTVLSEANFVTAFNFNIDPEKNALRSAKFSPYGLIGLLGNYGIIVDDDL